MGRQDTVKNIRWLERQISRLKRSARAAEMERKIHLLEGAVVYLKNRHPETHETKS